MLDSVLKAMVAHKQIVVTVAAFAIVMGSFSAFIPNAAAIVISTPGANGANVVVENGQAIVNTNDGRYVHAGDGRATVIVLPDGTVVDTGGGSDISGFLSGFMGGFFP